MFGYNSHIYQNSDMNIYTFKLNGLIYSKLNDYLTIYLFGHIRLHSKFYSFFWVIS